MLLLRNPEIKNMLAAYGLFTAAAAIGALLVPMSPAIYVIVVCALALLLFLFVTERRYRDISCLSGRLDRILHGEERTCFVPDKEGELALLSSEIYKMTVRLQEQTELLEHEKQLLHSSIADISHQIRTPLTSIRMVVLRLTREETTVEQRYEYSREINALLTRMEWLISSLLKIARLEAGSVTFERGTVHVDELVQKALAPLEIPAELKELTLNISVPPEITFEGDLHWSIEAVGNILKNCMEHTPEHGSLTITAEENPLYTGITVTDTGGGINPEDLPHLFERFYKGKQSGLEHAGIGLSLSRMIIERQQGTVSVQNIRPDGAEFRIRFYKGAI